MPIVFFLLGWFFSDTLWPHDPFVYFTWYIWIVVHIIFSFLYKEISKGRYIMHWEFSYVFIVFFTIISFVDEWAMIGVEPILLSSFIYIYYVGSIFLKRT